MPGRHVLMLLRLSIAYTARSLKDSATSNERLALAQRRQRLATTMKAFHKAADRHLRTSISTTGVPVDADPTDFGRVWDEVQGLGGSWGSSAGVPGPGLPPEPDEQPLALPSTLGYAYLARHNLTDLAVKEQQLREGQMNDCLQGVRTAIAYKSLLYRTRVRTAESYRKKLRSFDEVRVTDDGLMKHVRAYGQARRAIERLFNDDPTDTESMARREDLLTRYKEIRREDLGVTTAVLEHFTHGLRNVHTSWIWHVEDAENAQRTTWLQECEYTSCFPGDVLITRITSPSDALASGVCPEVSMGGGKHPGALRNGLYDPVLRHTVREMEDVVREWTNTRAYSIRITPSHHVD